MSTPRTRRSRQVIFKVTDAERERFHVGAKLAKLRFSTWARSVLLAEVAKLEGAIPEPQVV